MSQEGQIALDGIIAPSHRGAPPLPAHMGLSPSIRMGIKTPRCANYPSGWYPRTEQDLFGT